MYEEKNPYRNCYLNVFGRFDPGDLNLWPSQIGLLCYLGWMCGPSLRKVGQGVLELLIRNEKITDGQTDRHVQSNMPSLLWRGTDWDIQKVF